MTTAELEKVVKQLRHPLPLIGTGAQRKACLALAADGGAGTVPHLVWALTAQDAEVCATANAALRALKSPAAVDALCALWVNTRDTRVGEIIAANRYVAQQPVKVRVLSALQANQPEQAGDAAEAIQVLVAALAACCVVPAARWAC